MSDRSEGRRNPLGRLGQGFPYRTSVLPHQPCTACGAGDATRVIVVAGKPAWLVAGLVVVVDVEEDVAAGMVDDTWDALHQYEDGRRVMAVRLCRACARQATAKLPGVNVYSATKFEHGEYDGQPLHGLTQPTE